MNRPGLLGRRDLPQNFGRKVRRILVASDTSCCRVMCHGDCDDNEYGEDDESNDSKHYASDSHPVALLVGLANLSTRYYPENQRKD